MTAAFSRTDELYGDEFGPYGREDATDWTDSGIRVARSVRWPTFS
jgi:hypothetical protein